MKPFKEVLNFYKNKKVFITGHTGFKGSWLSHILLGAGAKVTGYALAPSTDDDDSLFRIAAIEGRENMDSVIADIRDAEALKAAVKKAQPEIVFHLAAQPLVIESYKRPAYTYETNVMGTVNILEAVRESGSVKSFLNVTTDKVYYNDESGRAFDENVHLDGYDPYSNSKSCSELVTACYKRSFMDEENIAVTTARAGNVIGGGDFAKNRIVPDCVRGGMKNESVLIRNPASVRPYQHVLEPLFIYLMLAMSQYEDIKKAGSYNVGPDEADCVNTGRIAQIFKEKWGEGFDYECGTPKGPHEAGFLRLDCTRLKKDYGWAPVWNVEKAIEKVVEWSKAYAAGAPVTPIMDAQIREFIQ